MIKCDTLMPCLGGMVEVGTG